MYELRLESLEELGGWKGQQVQSKNVSWEGYQFFLEQSSCLASTPNLMADSALF